VRSLPHRSRSSSRRRIQCVLTSCLVIVTLVRRAEAQGRNPAARDVMRYPVTAVERGAFLAEQRDFRIVLKCNDTIPGQRVARISWPMNASLLGNRRLDLTPFPGGFAKGIFASMYPLSAVSTEARLFQSSPNAPQSNRSLRLRARLDPGRSRVDSTSLLIDGLRAGLSYEWRLLTLVDTTWRPTAIIRTLAPVCPADRVR
jgi:hypothetical protein